MSFMEEEGFVLVSKDGLVAEDDDAVSVSSSRSSLFLVEDPATDLVLLHGEEEDPICEPEKQPEAEQPDPPAASGSQTAQEEPKEVPAEPEKEAVPRQQPKYVCSSCSCDVAATSDIIWEGYMGANKAAFLFGKVLNLEPAAEPRKQQLSTGMFLLQDVRCRTCSTPFGWSYLKAWSQDQKYKEGTTIVQQSLLQLVGDRSDDESTILAALRC